jgi:hypothetical protein
MKLSTRSPQPPGDLDDEAEVEVAAVLERLDTAEEWRVLWERLRSGVEHGGLDLDPPTVSGAGAEAHPLLPRVVLHSEGIKLLGGYTERRKPCR